MAPALTAARAVLAQLVKRPRVNKFEVETMSALEPLRQEFLGHWSVRSSDPSAILTTGPEMARALGRVLADWRCHLLLGQISRRSMGRWFHR